MTTQFTEVEFGGETVKVPKGGYYDRYRMNPNLDEIAKDPAAGDIEFFRRFPKTQITTRAGQTWAPNFYYRTSSVQLLMLAPLVKLRVMLPPPLNPLKALPGYGLVALTFYSYLLCDNDPYNEVSVAVVVRRPGARGSNTLELLDSMKRRSFYGHVLALPVDTAIARVRGVQGYQLPKWLTQIDFDLDGKVAASIFSSDGSPDVTLSSPLPALTQAPSQSALSTNTAIGLVDGEWRQTTVLTNPLSISQQLFPRDVKLTRNGVPVSQLLDGLGAGRILRMDVIADAQMVLNMPRKATLREI